jgi:hypothetical protein
MDFVWEGHAHERRTPMTVSFGPGFHVAPGRAVDTLAMGGTSVVGLACSYRPYWPPLRSRVETAFSMLPQERAKPRRWRCLLSHARGLWSARTLILAP